MTLLLLMRGSQKVLIGISAAAAGAALLGASRLLGRHPVGNRRVPEPLKPVLLDRYLGRWYELARYEQQFERGCEAATADYELRPDGKIAVLNRCRKSNGTIAEARGIAKIVDPQTNAKLKVSFFGPFYGSYWILDHAEDYAWSIVGEPSGRYLWILARNPRPDNRQIEELTKRASELGYDTSMLVFDNQ